MATKTTIDDVLHAVNEGFGAMERQFSDLRAHVDTRIDRLEKIVDSWPPPSLIRDLLDRVGKLERRQGVLETKADIKAE